MFKFSFWPWSSQVISKWDDPRLLLGISDADPLLCQDVGDDMCDKQQQAEQSDYYAKYELIVLLSVMIHRSVLKVSDVIIS